MRRLFRCLVALCTLIPLGFVWPAKAQTQEKRIALVIGNAGYQTGALETSANDAGLIAQTLQAAGFDVVGARDLDQDALRRALRDFLSKASSSGPDTVAFIYLSGYGLQLEGENYFLPIDTKIGRAADVAAEALRVSDYVRPLAALKLKASLLILDAARRNPFAISGAPLAGGLALVEPSPGTLVAFNAAPGTIAPDEDGPYGAYAQALAEMMREGGLAPPQVFERARLRVSDMTKGAQLPWFSSRLDTAFLFFERSPDAPALAAAGADVDISSKSIGDLPAADAYVAAVERDTLQAYEEFIAAFPGDPLAKRVRAIIAARREAITWQRTYAVNTPNAYWSYLRRYPHGPHGADARRRLALGSFALEPPAAFDLIDYDVPPPPAEEEIYVERPVLAFDDVDLGFVPPPSLPVYFLPPPAPDFVDLPAPLPAVEDFVLPVPVFISAATEQRDLHQHPQHDHRQSRNQSRDGQEWARRKRSFQAKRLRATKPRATRFRGSALARCPRAAGRRPCARRPAAPVAGGEAGPCAPYGIDRGILARATCEQAALGSAPTGNARAAIAAGAWKIEPGSC